MNLWNILLSVYLWCKLGYVRLLQTVCQDCRHSMWNKDNTRWTWMPGNWCSHCHNLVSIEGSVYKCNERPWRWRQSKNIRSFSRLLLLSGDFFGVSKWWIAQVEITAQACWRISARGRSWCCYRGESDSSCEQKGKKTELAILLSLQPQPRWSTSVKWSCLAGLRFRKVTDIGERSPPS